MTKIMTIVGTRPEVIRLSSVIKRLDDVVDHTLIHTGQNYDHSLNQVFFDDLGIREPDRRLAVDTSSLGTVLGDTLIKTEEVLREFQPDGVLVLGDTNSSIAAVMAKRMLVPVYHMEAGNRCFDENVPEETNRRLVDHVADFNLVYTEHARRNLLREGIHPRRILLTGSPMHEVLEVHRESIVASDVLERVGLRPGGYFLVSAHREENVDSVDRLKMFLDCLGRLHDHFGLPIVVSTHPRTRNRLNALNDCDVPEGVRWLDPFGFHDYCKLQVESACVLSDSGTVSEESSILGFPAVTLRDSVERPEALDAGSIIMTGLDATNVIQAVEVMQSAATRSERAALPDGYEIRNTSTRVVNFIISTVQRHREWSGLRG